MNTNVLKIAKKLRLWFFTFLGLISLILLKYKEDIYKRTVRSIIENVQHQFDKETQLFYHYWNLQHEQRFNYNAILQPCKSDLKWLPYYPNRNASFITSAKTSKVVLDIQPAGQYSRLLITSYSLLNTRKRIGGDSWRVLIHGASSVPVTQIDNLDGTYEMSFLITQPGSYIIELCLEYTMCDGYKDPPDDWFVRGNEQGKGQKDSVLPGFEKPYLEEKYDGDLSFTVKDGNRNIFKESLPSLQTKTPPSCLMWDGFGSWDEKLSWQPLLPLPFMQRWSQPKHRFKGILWIYGDSVGDFFYRAIWNTPLCKTLFKTCKHSYNWVYLLPHGKPPRTVSLPYDNKDFDIDRIKHEISEVLAVLSKNAESVLVLNLGLHYVMGIPIQTYVNLIDNIIDLILGFRKTSDNNVTIIWKTSTAVQKWKYGTPDSNARHAKSHRFLTQQRNEIFNAISMEKICKAGIPVLDVYPLSYSYPNGTGTMEKPWDAVHYDRKAFLSVEEYLTEYFISVN